MCGIVNLCCIEELYGNSNWQDSNSASQQRANSFLFCLLDFHNPLHRKYLNDSSGGLKKVNKQA